MRLYHASSVIVDKPDVCHSRDKLDFGRGFYLTKLYEQAARYAERFAIRGKEAYVNVYELDDDLGDFVVKFFGAYDEEWLDYVGVCRRGGQWAEHYDAVSGGVANDKVFNTIDLFFAGIITKDEALGRLRYEKPNHQLCILSDVMIESHLHFIEAIKL